MFELGDLESKGPMNDPAHLVNMMLVQDIGKRSWVATTALRLCAVGVDPAFQEFRLEQLWCCRWTGAEEWRPVPIVEEPANKGVP